MMMITITIIISLCKYVCMYSWTMLVKYEIHRNFRALNFSSVCLYIKWSNPYAKKNKNKNKISLFLSLYLPHNVMCLDEQCFSFSKNSECSHSQCLMTRMLSWDLWAQSPWREQTWKLVFPPSVMDVFMDGYPVIRPL